MSDKSLHAHINTAATAQQPHNTVMADIQPTWLHTPLQITRANICPSRAAVLHIARCPSNPARSSTKYAPHGRHTNNIVGPARSSRYSVGTVLAACWATCPTSNTAQSGTVAGRLNDNGVDGATGARSDCVNGALPRLVHIGSGITLDQYLFQWPMGFATDVRAIPRAIHRTPTPTHWNSIRLPLTHHGKVLLLP